MDKLKPLLEHKFWFLYAFALIMPPVGWWMTSGEMSTVIASRTGSIDKSFSTASQTAGKANIPNDGWTEQVKAINEQQQADLKRTTYKLWKVQRELMTWPAEMQRFMGQLSFRGIPAEYDDRLPASFMFGRGGGYRNAVVELKRILDPFDLREQTGKIVVSDAAWPVQETKFDRAERTRFPDIWNEMEDLWLLRDLFQAIDRVNRDANSLNESNIKELRKLTFHGGTSEAAAGGAATGFGGIATAPRTTFNNASSIRIAAQANFSPASVFGPPPEQTDGKPYDKRPRERFVHHGPGVPFVTRGFYMELIMDHRQVPELFSQLTKSSWPVEIKRIQVAELTDQSRKATGPAAKNENDANAEGLKIVASAMEDPYLALVSVAGLMMLFNPVEPPPETLQTPAETVAESADEPAAVTPETDADSADAEASGDAPEDSIAEDDPTENKPAEDESADAEEPDPAAGQDSPEQPQ